MAAIRRIRPSASPRAAALRRTRTPTGDRAAARALSGGFALSGAQRLRGLRGRRYAILSFEAATRYSLRRRWLPIRPQPQSRLPSKSSSRYAPPSRQIGFGMGSSWRRSPAPIHRPAKTPEGIGACVARARHGIDACAKRRLHDRERERHSLPATPEARRRGGCRSGVRPPMRPNPNLSRLGPNWPRVDVGAPRNRLPSPKSRMSNSASASESISSIFARRGSTQESIADLFLPQRQFLHGPVRRATSQLW